jgi:hypothetical protein
MVYTIIMHLISWKHSRGSKTETSRIAAGGICHWYTASAGQSLAA